MKRTAKVIISAAFFVMRETLDGLRRLVGGKREPRLVVLCYHAVPESAASRFQSQLRIIAKHAKVVEATADPAVMREDGVAITFDDAFRSVADNALEPLAKHNFHATIFAPAGVLGQTPAWRFERGYDSDRNERIMTAQELLQLDPARVRLGCHSMRHPRLTDLDDAGLHAEVVESRQHLEMVLGRRVTTLAFPYGAHDPRVVEACRRAGYEAVFSITPKPTGAAPQYVRGRVTVEPYDSPLEFYLKMRGAYSWMAGASEVKASILRTLRRQPSGQLRTS